MQKEGYIKQLVTDFGNWVYADCSECGATHLEQVMQNWTKEDLHILYQNGIIVYYQKQEVIQKTLGECVCPQCGIKFAWIQRKEISD